MKPPIFIGYLLFLLLTLCSPLAAQTRQEIPLDRNWRFIREDVANAETPSFNDKDWLKINLPHTWNNKDVQSLAQYDRGPAWYRLSFDIPSRLQNKRLFVRFEGVGSVAKVYLNGEELGEHPGAFGAFAFDISKQAKPGQKNVLAVRADNSFRPDLAPISGGFPVCGGIYRQVQLLGTDPLCISPLDHGSSGVKILTDVNDSKATLNITTQLSNGSSTVQSFLLKTSLLDAKGKLVVSNEKEITLAANSANSETIPLIVNQPHLWNGLHDPYLYRTVVEIIRDGKTVDSVTQNTGLRYFHVDPLLGFFLNGKPYPLHGVCLHQDRQNKGWAISDADIRQDIELIKEIGANTVRAAHYPHSDYLYELCDQAGLLVWTELPQVSSIRRVPGFDENSAFMLKDMIRLLINHPSIYCWGLSNEIGNRPTDDASGNIALLQKVAKQEDPTRPTVQAVNNIKQPVVNHTTDLIGWNLYPGWYPLNPDNMSALLDVYRYTGKQPGFCISEYGAGGSVYQQEYDPRNVNFASRWHPEAFQATVHERAWADLKTRPWVWGTYIWNMFDFANPEQNEGDRPSINDKGLVTYDRQVKKDVFYFYKANWSPEPVLYIAERRYTKRNGEKTYVKVFSNLGQVELKINGMSAGLHHGNPEMVFRWENQVLKRGENNITVSGVKDGRTYTDSCTWWYDPGFPPLQQEPLPAHLR